MDGLKSNEERALAWINSWHSSFVGIAIVDGDFTFRSANPQFCKILGVTPGDLLGNSFVDITPEPVKSTDRKNANLTKKGVIKNYMMNKVYQMPDGREIPVSLLVHGVHHPTTGEFLFFVSTILERVVEVDISNVLSQKSIGWLDWIDIKKAGWTILAAIATIIALVIEKRIK